jgi:hypothetical protein
MAWCFGQSGVGIFLAGQFNSAASSEESHEISISAADRRSTPLCEGWLQNLWFDSIPEALGALPNLFQYRFQGSQLFRARIGKDFPNFGSVFAKNRRDQFFASWCERHDPDAPILRTLDPAYQAPSDESVNGRADRAGRKVHLWTDRIHRQGPFVEECFQYPEVGIVDSRLLKTCIQIFRGRPKGLPQY